MSTESLNPSRRQLGKLAAALLATSALAACANLTSAQITAQAVQYAQDVANGLATIATSLQGVPANVVTTVTNIAKQAVAAAESLTTSLTQTAGKPIVQQIQADVSAVLTDIGGFVQSPTTQQIIADINTVIQVLLPLVGLIPALGATPSASEVAAADDRLHALPVVTFGG